MKRNTWGDGKESAPLSVYEKRIGGKKYACPECSRKKEKARQGKVTLR